MVIDEYVDKLNSSIPKLIDEETFTKVLRLNNNLCRLNILNRIALATMYNQEIFDIKSEEEWFSVGRKVINKKDAIYLAIPMYTTSYIDTVSGEKVEVDKFTPDELTLAIKLRVISKEDVLDKIIPYKLYDIKNTSNIDKNIVYNVPKPEINMPDYFKIIHEITGITIEESDSSFFYEKDKVLFLSRDNYENTLDTLTDTLLKYMIHNLTDYVVDVTNYDHLDITNKRREKLISACVKYSIKTLFGIDNRNEVIMALRYSGIVSVDELIDILMLSDELIFNVIKYVKYSSDTLYTDISTSINRIKKSELLLNILQANSVHNKIEGS